MSDTPMRQQRQIRDTTKKLRTLEAADPPGMWLVFVPLTSLQPFSANGTYFYAGLPYATHTPLRFRLWAFVATTNTGAAYWQISLLNSAGDPIGQLTTAAQGPNVWVASDLTTFDITPLTSAADQIVQVVVAKVGVPGSLSMIPMLYTT